MGNKRWHQKKWLAHYYSAKSRCLRRYKIYGVHFDITRKDVEFLWFRDQADLMVHPSIDRINTLGNYSILNCRFIENSDNKKRLRRKSILSSNRFKGVYYQEDHKKFRAIISINGKFSHLGYFSNEIDAANAYNNACVKLNQQPLNSI